MRRLVIVAALAFAAPSLAFAHVTVRPRESKAGADEKYTVRVPTEGTVATTHVQLEIPAGVTVLEVVPQDGATFETTKQGDRITAITWRKEIPPKAAAEFVFSARNPAMGDIVWKAHQHFADGTAADWVGAAGERRPASVTKLAATIAEQPIDSSRLEALVRSRQPPKSPAAVLALLVATTPSVYKPRGMTRYGWRKPHEQRTASQP